MQIGRQTPNLQGFKIERLERLKIENDLKRFPVVAIVGVRQFGKTTITKEIVADLKESSVWESLSITTSSTIRIFILEINPKSS